MPAAAALRTFCETALSSLDVGSLIRYIVESLSAGVPPARRPDPRITKVLDLIAYVSSLTP